MAFLKKMAKPGLKFAGKLVFLFLWAHPRGGLAQRAKSSANQAVGLGSKKSASSAAAAVAQTAVVSIKDQKAVFPVKPFGAVKPRDRFYLLTAGKSGVTVELEVEKLSTDAQYAFAKVVQNPLEIPPENFVQSIVARATDVKLRAEQFSDGPVAVKFVKPLVGFDDLYLNPTALVALGVRSETALAPNILTGVDLNVPQLMQDLYFSAAVAPVGKISWVNQFGFDLLYSRARQAKLTLKRSRAQSEQAVTVDSDEFRLGLFMRPAVNWRFLSRVGVRLDVLGTRTETLKFGASQFSELDPQVKQTLTTKGLVVALNYEANPLGVLFAGVDITLPFKRQLVAKNSENQNGNAGSASDNGTLNRTEISPYMVVRFPFGTRPDRFALESKACYLWRQDAVAGFSSVLGSAGHTQTQTGFGGLLGVSFTH